jgi:hypothetical protein
MRLLQANSSNQNELAKVMGCVEEVKESPRKTQHRSEMTNEIQQIQNLVYSSDEGEPLSSLNVQTIFDSMP